MIIKTKRPVIWLAAVLCASTLVMSGCSSSRGYKRAEATSNSIDAMRAEILSGKDQIQATVDAMNDVVASASSDPRPAYETFTKEYGKTQKQAGKASKRAATIRKKGAAYFKAWETEFEKVASPELRKSFEQRKADLQDEYAKIQAFSKGLKKDFETFMSNLNDVNIVLGVDLTSKGIASTSDYVKEATTTAVSINKRLDQYIKVLDRVAAEMRPSTGSSE